MQNGVTGADIPCGVFSAEKFNSKSLYSKPELGTKQTISSLEPEKFDNFPMLKSLING